MTSRYLPPRPYLPVKPSPYAAVTLPDDEGNRWSLSPPNDVYRAVATCALGPIAVGMSWAHDPQGLWAASMSPESGLDTSDVWAAAASAICTAAWRPHNPAQLRRICGLCHLVQGAPWGAKIVDSARTLAAVMAAMETDYLPHITDDDKRTEVDEALSRPLLGEDKWISRWVDMVEWRENERQDMMRRNSAGFEQLQRLKNSHRRS